ncbi:MAG: hypothetical protein V9E89_12740 [Ilumatobacteraceae bacterium]
MVRRSSSSPVTQIMYADDSILLGYVYTDEAIQFSGEFPTVAIESGYEKNPQMIMWDPGTYPDVKGIADLGTDKRQDPLLRWRGIHGLPHGVRHPVQEPGRRFLHR